MNVYVILKTIFSPHLLNASESLSDINLAHSPPPSERYKGNPVASSFFS